MTYAFINGEFTENISINPYDLGFLRGFGIFECFRTYDKVPLFLEDRLTRMRNSASELRIRIPYTDEQIKEIVLNLIEMNGFSETNVRIIATKGVSHDGIHPEGDPSFYILATPFFPFPDSYYQIGIKTATTLHTRFLSHIKTLHYLPGLLALEEAREYDADEVLYCNEQNQILEGTTSNFFGIKGDKVITAPNQVLFGLTRKLVLKAIREHFEIEMRHISLDEIPQLDEAFITSSLREVVPVIQIDQHMIGEGRCGPHTEIILDLFRSALFELSLN